MLRTLIPHTQTNGFHGARGVSKYVPLMYVRYAREFLQSIRSGRMYKGKGKVTYQEYEEKGWTFHSKGECRYM